MLLIAGRVHCGPILVDREDVKPTDCLHKYHADNKFKISLSLMHQAQDIVALSKRKRSGNVGATHSHSYFYETDNALIWCECWLGIAQCPNILIHVQVNIIANLNRFHSIQCLISNTIFFYSCKRDIRARSRAGDESQWLQYRLRRIQEHLHKWTCAQRKYHGIRWVLPQC